MNTHRIDFRDTDVGYVHTAQPAQGPVLRPDSAPADRPAAACCGDCAQGRKVCPSPMVCMGLHRVELANGQTRSAAETWHRRDVQQAAKLVRRKRSLPWVAAVMLVSIVGACTMAKARAADGETAATIAAGADTASTVAVVATGAGVEANALMAHPAVFAVASIAKLAAPRLTRDMQPEQRRTVLRGMTTFWGAAAVNNLAILAGAGCPPCLGVAAGVALWIREGRRDPAPITAPEADAQLALAPVAEVMP